MFSNYFLLLVFLITLLGKNIKIGVKSLGNSYYICVGCYDSSTCFIQHTHSKEN